MTRARQVLRPIVWVAVLILLAGCVPAAQNDLPREVRGPEVHPQRQRAISVVEDQLASSTGSSPVLAGLDGCVDLRPRPTGYAWRCTVVRATTVTGTDLAPTLATQRQRLLAAGCSAYPGLGTTARRAADGLTPGQLYPVQYHCPDEVLITLRFSEPTDPGLQRQLDLGTLPHGPGRSNLISEQPYPADGLRLLQADTTKSIIMVLAVQKDYWMLPRSA